MYTGQERPAWGLAYNEHGAIGAAMANNICREGEVYR
jgi:hypothetical protein